jgi:nucleoside-diphosphate-sugar epimerase
MTGQHRILITGSAGVIGRQLTSRLLGPGAVVLGIDREPMPLGDWNGLHFERGDLSEMDLDLIAEFSPTIVYHLAASFERSEETPEYWSVGWRDDVVAAHRVIDVVTKQGVAHTFVFASSYLVYDPSQYMVDDPELGPIAIDERAPIAPRNLCGAGKYYTERELRYVQRTIRPDLRVVNARIFRVFGRGSRDVISRWIRAGLSDEPIEVFNRLNRFDYVFADDVAEALERLGGDPGATGVYNIGSGMASTIDDVLSCLTAAGIIASEKILDTGDTAPYEASLANVGRLRGQLGWSPSTSLDRGIGSIAETARERSGA